MTRRRTAGVAVTAAMVIALAGVSVGQAPAAFACSRFNPNCVSVDAGSPGSSGSAGRSSGGGQGAGGSLDASGGSAAGAGSRGGSGGEATPAPVVNPAGLASAATVGCWWVDAPVQPAAGPDARLGGHKLGSGVVQQEACLQMGAGVQTLAGSVVGSPVASGRTRFVPNGAGGAAPAAPPPSPATLARWAAASFVLPDPVVGRFPSGAMPDGRPYTVVNTNMWYWTDASVWHPLSATARAGGNWATVVATPAALSLLPGNGAAGVSCPGPGRVFDPDTDSWPASWAPRPEPSGCDYVYPRASYSWDGYPDEEVTATVSITWRLAWTGSGNTSGTFTQRTTSARQRYVVAELQSLVTG